MVCSFGGEDSGGAQALPVSLTVRLCNCGAAERGECVWDQLQDGFRNNDTFQLVECNCRLPLYDGILPVSQSVSQTVDG